MALLKRVGDGAGDMGARSQALSYNEDGTFKAVVSDLPTVGCGFLVGSVTARSYSEKDYWLTTPVTKILEERIENDGAVYIKFATENSVYEFWK